ncbi:MAG: hypothetical protein LQ351_001197 [Letrouitia transgressa]|nr:MAG: hypothetical protein LQ351_001197 [Letrouitia transgressa]
MSTPFVIANLLQESQQHYLRLENTVVQSTWHDDSYNPALSIYTLRNGRTKTDYMSTVYQNHCKATAKALVALTALVQLLAGEATVANTAINCQVISALPHQDEYLPSATIGDTIAIADEASDGAVTGAYSRNLFLPVNFNFPVLSEGKIRNICSTQYLQAISPTSKLNDALPKQQNRPTFESVNFVTGVCLYSDNILKASLSDSDGRINVEELSFAPATINELESIVRCSSSLADIAMMFISRMRNENYTQTINITVDIPSWQYYWSIVTKFEQGSCTASEALQWVEAVDLRHDQISHVFRSAVRHELQKRGASAEDADIQISQKKNAAAISIRQSLRNGKIPTLEYLLQSLKSESCSLWKDFYSLISDKDRPKDVHALGNLSYVFEVVKIALRKSKTRSPYPRLILSIDDRMEHRIYFIARNILKQLQSSSRKDLPRSIFLEIYTARRLFVDSNKSRRRFFYYDPTPKIFSATSDLGIEDSWRRLVTPLHVIGRLFGSEEAQNLKKWMGEVGLQERAV